MFPLNDFNIVACALATFTAAVGYNVSRKRGRSQSNGRAENRPGRFDRLKFRRDSTASVRSTSSAAPTESDCDTSVVSEPSYCGSSEQAADLSFNESVADESEDAPLKRKRSPTPEVVVSDTPPAKRRRTPSVEDPEYRKEESAKVEDSVPQSRDAAVCSRDAPRVDPALDDPKEGDLGGSASPGVSETPSDPLDRTEAVNPTTPPPPPVPEALPAAHSATLVRPASPGVKPPLPVWHAANAIVAAKPSAAFQAFSGQPSAFASSSNAFGGAQRAPVWSTNPFAKNDNDSSPISALGATQAADLDPLAALSHSEATQKVVTGEEDEVVERELKGAKVFIKRGSRDFCEGILGNVKLLKHTETGAERILFRREPVWKVTMCVRLRPTVRCAFDEAQGALRVTLKEPVEGTQDEQVVIYALRRGKSSRADFAQFARAVVGSARLQEQQERA